MPEELRKEEPMVDVGETEGAEIDLDKDNSVQEQKKNYRLKKQPIRGKKQKKKKQKKKHHRKKNLNNIVKVLRKELQN